MNTLLDIKDIDFDLNLMKKANYKDFYILVEKLMIKECVEIPKAG